LKDGLKQNSVNGVNEMEKIKCFEYVSWNEKGPFLFEIAAEDFSITGSFEVNGKIYTAQCFDLKTKEADITEIIIKSEENNIEDVAEDEITCPYCGYAQCDSWECEQDKDKEVCEECGGTFSYYSETTTIYTSEPVSAPNPVKYEKV